MNSMQYSDHTTLQYPNYTTALPASNTIALPISETITTQKYKVVWESPAEINIKFPSFKEQLTPTKVIFNGKCCIAFFPDGKKIIVRKNENDQFDEYTAVAYCIIKYIFESNSRYKKTIDKIVKKPHK